MTGTMAALIGELIREHSMTLHHKVLFCAKDVADDLAEAIGPPVKPKPWEADLTWLMGIDVVVTPDSAPGSWRLIRHDHCEVIDVAGPDGEPDYGKSYVSHQGCTILAESRPAA